MVYNSKGGSSQIDHNKREKEETGLRPRLRAIPCCPGREASETPTGSWGAGIAITKSVVTFKDTKTYRLPRRRSRGSCGSWPKATGVSTVGGSLYVEVCGATNLLLDLQAVHDRGKLAQDLVGLLVILNLGSDEIGEVAEGLRGVKDLMA